MNSLEEVLEYWRSPGKLNNSIHYLRGKDKLTSTKFLLALIKELEIEREATFLEPGCNAGRNLIHLWKAGYKNLSGIELNKKAVILMGKQFPEMETSIYEGDMAEILPELPRYDVVFTMAVLTHIHPDVEDVVFSEIAVRAKRYLITIESETADNERHTPRNYREVFEPFGFKQAQKIENVPGMVGQYVTRVFER